MTALISGTVVAAALVAPTAPAQAHARTGGSTPGPITSLERPGPVGRGVHSTTQANPDGKIADGSVRRRDARSASTLPEVGAVCPSGQVVKKTYLTAGFEDGEVPNPDYSVGWTVGAPSAGAAPEGALVARSASAVDTATDNVINPIFASVDPGASLYVSVTYRGTFAPGEVGLYVNDGSGALAPSTQWRTTRVNATAGASFGTVEVFVDLVTAAKGTVSQVEIDDVRAWSCAAIPATGIRGDWTGDTLVDLFGITAAGELWLYPGRGTGGVGAGVLIGGGWSTYSWVGSPGDVTGDRRSDLVGRGTDGRMYLYAGAGGGAFSARKEVGSGWSAMTAFATPTDMNLDGSPELLARRSDSTLHLYSFSSTGALRYLKQVGSGWNGMSWIIGMGDLNSDRRGDTVGVNRDNACLYAYVTTSALTLGSATKVGCGWSGMTFLASPGDLNGDKLGDLVARAADGGLWFYPGKAGGGVRAGVKVGSGWTGMAVIL
ncbi:FG-GAP-like repeat-containing protein [Janibacter sp. HTCC2649]|uniref:FG-GAP-like repeat-containing protein n=1 Tax=Janibacter sp. HTCC2649 TaxID=313589 RepID=UPI0011D228A2|nr:FG-GAP-like repeat-containing protein [Janibacter sp. HTCC2649]